MFKKFVIHLILTTFFFTSIGPVPNVFAQSLIDLPAPGVMVNRSISFEPLQIKGILVNTKNPLRFDFLVDKGDSGLHGQLLKDDITRLAKYFLTCLTVPENDLWVNLSPYEKDRIVPGNFGITLMGKDLLEQDYLLKQMMASLSYPENDLGRRFWHKVYHKAYLLYGTTQIPINTFNKVWITPKSAEVYVQGNSAFVINSQLDVMLEADYLAMQKHQTPTHTLPNITSSIMREVILPQLRQEINEGKNFAHVRQVYNAMILATWYKLHLKDSLLGQGYVGKNNVRGVDIADKGAKEKIFQRYLRAYKRGVYNYVKEDYDPSINQTVARKYASGGMYFAGFSNPGSVYKERPSAKGIRISSNLAMAVVNISATNGKGEVVSFPDMRAEITNTNPFHQVPRDAKALAHNNVIKGSRYLRSLILPLVLSVGGFMMTPTMASAGTFLPNMPKPQQSIQSPIMNDELPKLKEQLKSTDQQILERQQKINNELAQFKERDRAHEMRPAEISMHQGSLRYNKGILKELTHQRYLLNNEIKIIQDFRKVTQQAVFKATASGVPMLAAPVLPHVTPPAPRLNSVPSSPAKETLAVSKPPVAPIAQGSRITQTTPALTPLGHGALTTVLTNRAPSLMPSSSNENPFFIYSSELTNSLIEVKASFLTNAVTNTDTVDKVTLGNTVTNAQALQKERFNLKILKRVKPMWLLYGALGILGIGVGNGLWKKLKKPKIEKKVKPITKTAIKEDKSSPIELVVQTSNQPPGMTDQEKDLLPGQEAKLQALISQDRTPIEPQGINGFQNLSKENVSSNPQSLSGYSPKADALGWISGMMLGGIAYSFDPLSLMLTALALPMVNAVYSTSNVWLHEIGHTIAAAILYPLPRYWKKSLRPSNLKGNLSFKQWKDFFVSRLRGKEYQGDDPYFSFPAKGLRDSLISQSGTMGTIAVNTIALLAGFWTVLEHTWLMPLMGIMGVGSYSAIKSALLGDRHGSNFHEASLERQYSCGISVHSQIGKRKVLANRGNDVSIHRMTQMIDAQIETVENTSLIRIKDMMKTESQRGRHQVGIMAMREGLDGRVQVIVEKAIELKRGYASDAVETAAKKLESSLPPIISSNETADEHIMDTFVGHNRLASANLVKMTAAHPHIGQNRRRILWSRKNGLLIEGRGLPANLNVQVARPADKDQKQQIDATKDLENVNAGSVHNGDGDAYQPLSSDRFIDDLDELRGFAIKMVRFKSELPPGDSPVIPLLIQYHLTQGDAYASVSFAHNKIDHMTIKELEDDLLGENEEIQAGEILNRGIRKFASLLSRPGLNDPDAGLNSLYVSRQTAKENPGDAQIQFQYRALEQLKKYLVEEFKKEAAAGNLSEKMTHHWQGLKGEKIINDFVELALYKYFTGDRDTAVDEFLELSKGTYGLAVKVSTDLNGLTLVARKLGMVFGVNLAKGYLDASSDPYALLKKYKNGDQLDKLMFLDPKGRGERANFQVSKLTGKLSVRVYSAERKIFISEDEMFQREYPLTKNNRYFKPIHEYADDHRQMMEDLQIITPAISDLSKSFDDKNSIRPLKERDFNYQSKENVLKKLLGLWINKKVNKRLYESGEYYAIFLRIQKAVKALAEDCTTSALCSESHKEFLKIESKSTAENSILMKVFIHWISIACTNLAAQQVDGEINQKDVSEVIPKLIEARKDRIIHLLSERNIARIYKSWDFMRKHPDLGKEKIGMLFAGDENSDYGPRNAESIWNTLLPQLPKRFVSSWEILDYQSLPFDVRSPAVTILTSKAGGNFNTMQALDVMLNAVGSDHVFGVTSRPDSPLSVALGQKLRPESPFSGHLFYTGDNYAAQTQVASESLTSALHNLLAISVALDLEKYCPGEHPFGLNLTAQNIEYLTKLKQEMMLKDAKRITGFDEEHNRVISPANQGLVKRGKFWASRLWETPAVTWVYRLFVYGIFIYGAPIHCILTAMGYNIGPPLETLNGFLTGTSDFMLAMTMPLLLTLIYRKFSSYVPWVRLGAPANINLIGSNSNPDIQKMLFRVIFSRSYASWSSQTHASIYQKAIAELGPIINRGSWIIGHLGGTPSVQRTAKGAFKQLKVTRTGLFGSMFKRTGGISFTTSRGPFEDPQGVVSDYNVDLGGKEFLPAKDDQMARVYNVLDAWGATLALKVSATVMADTLTFKGKVWNPSLKVNWANHLTTEAGQPPPDKMPMDEDKAQLTPKGGIDMNSRLMKLNITVKSSSRRAGFEDKAILSLRINSVVPMVTQILPVTSDMLKAMLGQGYLN